MKTMTKWERVEAALHGGEVDRVPIALWKHYHLQDRGPRQLADITMKLYRQFDFDLVKLTPSGLTPIQDWGATIKFGVDDDFLPLAVAPVISSPKEWASLPTLNVTRGALGRELETIGHVYNDMKGEAPFMMTIFSPLTVAFKLCGDKISGVKVIDHLREAPAEVHKGLKTITKVVTEYAMACLAAGASGFFYATQMTNYDYLTKKEYEEFGVPYDMQVLEALRGKSRVTMLHVCKKNLMFDLVTDYPVHVINWADKESGPTLGEARQMTKRALAGGLSLDTLLDGTTEAVKAEARHAIAQAGRTNFILAPTCVIKGPSPDANLAAARAVVEETRR